MKRFLAVLHARNMEFIRDRSALSWNVLFPLLLVLGFAFMFSGESKDLYKVGVIGETNALSAAFFNTEHIQFIPVDDQESSLQKVAHHKLDMLINVRSGKRYWINSSSPSGYVLERVLWGTGGKDYRKEVVEGKEIRYVDWVVPGILAMNMMFSCLFGVGYVIVRYRKNGFLKRLKATPLTPLPFLLAQMASRLILIEVITIAVYVGCDFFIDFQMLGSYANLLLISVVGAICLISLGLLVAARLASEELAGGLLNLLTWPMMLLSGVWFSLEGTHSVIQKSAQVLPLTHLVDGARAIMTEGASLSAIAPNLLVLSLMSVGFLLIGSLIFRLE